MAHPCRIGVSYGYCEFQRRARVDFEIAFAGDRAATAVTVTRSKARALDLGRSVILDRSSIGVALLLGERRSPSLATALRTSATRQSAAQPATMPFTYRVRSARRIC